MIKRWSLENFKPIHGDLDLHLGKVTVLAGLNSSGKSSVLQSILLVQQTLANQSLEKALILNGNSVQLGTFDGVRNDRAPTGPIGIGFELSLAEERRRSPVQRSTRYSRLYRGSGDPMRSVTVAATFTGAAQPVLGESALEAVRVALECADVVVYNDVASFIQRTPASPLIDVPGDRVSPAEVHAHIQRIDEQETQTFLQGVRESFLRFVPYRDGDNYTVNISNKSAAKQPVQLLLAHLAHFLPNRFVAKFNIQQRQRREVSEAIQLYMISVFESDYPLSPFGRTVVEQLRSRPVDGDLGTRIKEIVEKTKSKPFPGGTAADLLQWAHNTSLRGRAKSAFTSDIQEAVYQSVIEDLHIDDETGNGLGLENTNSAYGAEFIEAATQEINSYFTSMIRYLGPLRADPQAAQGFAPSSEPDDVGSKGEYAAAVYDANKRQRITWWNPSSEQQVEGSLEEAMSTWVRHIGVAHRVSTREAGLSGVSWMIQSKPQLAERPLPAVGVGVSQVLPILVAGLLAPIGVLMLIEQPELHLHVQAQARLGDFFLGLARVGKQCIIETHSDCLVNQFRYHMVREGTETRESILIYFVEQDDQGDSRISSIQVSDSGNILNWPVGFFDESLHQESLITREAVLARAGRVRDA